ncbi:MAG TPA: OsmC family protein [Candidatus Polarisedimenticolaceae bacterium]|nr:OsmC family protein [Candidatus Polarisedimenticolaceae bacterium]
MAMQITIGSGGRVDAVYKGRTIRTAQDGTEPAPFDLFLASIGTCTGYYVARFCESRGIPTDGIRIEQTRVIDEETRMVERVRVEINLPDDFPERYREALLRSAALCSVKKHLERPPRVEVETRIEQTAGRG